MPTSLAYSLNLGRNVQPDFILFSSPTYQPQPTKQHFNQFNTKYHAYHFKFGDIAKRIPGRVGKQVRERWSNHLDPALKKTNWTDEEDDLLTMLQSLYGNSWTKIAMNIEGRSENDVKNRWSINLCC